MLLPDLQIVTIDGDVPPERAGEVVATVREELARLREEGIAARALDAAREEQEAEEASTLADPGILASILVDLTELGEAADPALIERADDLTLEGMNAALRELIPDAAAAAAGTPEPVAVDANCVVDVPEDARGDRGARPGNGSVIRAFGVGTGSDRRGGMEGCAPTSAPEGCSTCSPGVRFEAWGDLGAVSALP